MKRIPIILSKVWRATALLVVAGLTLAACHRQAASGLTVIEGRIVGLGNDTVLVYGSDRLFDRVDSIFVSGDCFRWTLTPDTLTHAYLLFADGSEYPVFFGHGDRLYVSGRADSLSRLNVSGTTPNADMVDFHRELDDSLAVLAVSDTLMAADSLAVLNDSLATVRDSLAVVNDSLAMFRDSVAVRVAERFIRQHPHSLASLHVLARYFVEVESPDFDKILELSYSLAGELKDRPYVETLITRLEDDQKLNSSKAIFSLSLPNAQGEWKGRGDFRDKYLLIHFWASWDTASRKPNSFYRRLYRKEKKNEYFELIGVSLDNDSAAWQKAVKEDTLVWTQLIDRGGWAAQSVTQYALYRLPANILLNANGKLEGRDLSPAEIEQRLKDIDEEEQKKEERRKKRAGKK